MCEGGGVRGWGCERLGMCEGGGVTGWDVRGWGVRGWGVRGWVCVRVGV